MMEVKSCNESSKKGEKPNEQERLFADSQSEEGVADNELPVFADHTGENTGTNY
jgi:hypothetical protein